MSQVSSRVQSHIDFQGLGELKGQAQRNESGALREVAQQFEAMFIQQIMKTMREAGFKGGELVESQAMDTFQSMHDKEISLQMAKRGSFGLADMLVRSMEQQGRSIPAADALAARFQPESAGRPDRQLGPAGRGLGLPISKPLREMQINPVTVPRPLHIKDATALPLRRDLTLPGRVVSDE